MNIVLTRCYHWLVPLYRTDRGKDNVQISPEGPRSNILAPSARSLGAGAGGFQTAAEVWPAASRLWVFHAGTPARGGPPAVRAYRRLRRLEAGLCQSLRIGPAGLNRELWPLTKPTAGSMRPAVRGTATWNAAFPEVGAESPMALAPAQRVAPHRIVATGLPIAPFRTAPTFKHS